jgi:GxxExxY protein
MAEIEVVEKELSYRIMQAAFEVHNQLGPGFPEAIYEQAMARELPARGIEVERQRRVVVHYKGEALGEFILDMVADRRVILEFKAIAELGRIHQQQALSYLKASWLSLAIVINFGAARVQSSRVVHTRTGAGDLTLLPKQRMPK